MVLRPAKFIKSRNLSWPPSLRGLNICHNRILQQPHFPMTSLLSNDVSEIIFYLNARLRVTAAITINNSDRGQAGHHCRRPGDRAEGWGQGRHLRSWQTARFVLGVPPAEGGAVQAGGLNYLSIIQSLLPLSPSLGSP